jgi:hypothetical protein
MKRGSWKKHIDSAAHQTEIQRKVDRDSQKAADIARLLELQQASILSPTRFTDIHQEQSSLTLPTMFAQDDPSVTSSD